MDSERIYFLLDSHIWSQQLVCIFGSTLGTYNNLTHRTSWIDCQLCPGGEFCEQQGLVNPTGKCSAGYYCTVGANSSTPSQGTSANICPKGFYCPEGSVVPVSCPLGMYNPSVGRHSIDECTNCSGGRYCPYYNMTSPGPLCEPGRKRLLTFFFLFLWLYCWQYVVLKNHFNISTLQSLKSDYQMKSAVMLKTWIWHQGCVCYLQAITVQVEQMCQTTCRAQKDHIALKEVMYLYHALLEHSPTWWAWEMFLSAQIAQGVTTAQIQVRTLVGLLNWIHLLNRVRRASR